MSSLLCACDLLIPNTCRVPLDTMAILLPSEIKAEALHPPTISSNLQLKSYLYRRVGTSMCG